MSSDLYISLVQFSCSIVSDSLQPHGLQHARPPCPSPTPRVYSNSWPLSQWCHPTTSSSTVPFSSHLQSFPASESFQMSQLFASVGRSIGVSASASVLPMNIQDWFPLGWTAWISLLSKDLLAVLILWFRWPQILGWCFFVIIQLNLVLDYIYLNNTKTAHLSFRIIGSHYVQKDLQTSKVSFLVI